MTDFGTCWGTPQGQDLSTPSYMASGLQVVAEAVLRRWSTTPGQLLDDPNYGYDLTGLVSSDLSPSDIAYAQQQLSAEALQDERVNRCTVVLTFALGVLTVTAHVVTELGPFKLVLVVTAVSVTTLLVQT